MQSAISYRDKHGFVTIADDHRVYRYITHSYAKDYDQLIQSGLYQELVNRGWLIGHKESEMTETQQLNYYRILEPERIPLISYPSEWSVDQWRDVLERLLDINLLAIEYGMILKDATPYNFTFHNGHCLLFDTTSFEVYEEGKPWIAYRQFCETMLGPFALMCFSDKKWARLLNAFIDGWDLAFVSRRLSFRTWFNPTLLMHIHLHARYKTNGMKNATTTGNGFNKQKLSLWWKLMKRSISKWKPRQRGDQWLHYYDEDILSDEYINDKTNKVTEWIRTLSPDCLIDVGANNGYFSLIASAHAKRVIAVEMDHDCINQLYGKIKAQRIANLTTIIADLTQPTPGIGWENEEKTALMKRIGEKGDMVLGLALVHHLCISKNIPLAFVAKLFADITNKQAIVEFVPKTDEKVQAMLRHREDIFDDYTEADFITSFSAYFVMQEQHNCSSSQRKLFLWTRK
jgi:hypothetical protein